MTAAARYVLFASFAMLVNFAAQEAVVVSMPTRSLLPSIFAGTVAGFSVKYLLDKYWIFFDGYNSPAQEVRKITLYGFFSALTTLIFWSFEVAFWALWSTDLAKYSGGALGLALGYALKYRLDRKFVFQTNGI